MGSSCKGGNRIWTRTSRDKKKLLELVQNDIAYQEMDEDAYDMAVSYTNSKELISVKQYHEREGKVNMCEALTQLLADERQQGIEQGIEEGENRLGMLISLLMQKEENEIVMQVVQNESLRKEYYQKYGI